MEMYSLGERTAGSINFVERTVAREAAIEFRCRPNSNPNLYTTADGRRC